jgi:hypothetical protein
MAVFWVVAPCSLVEVYQLSEVLAASVIRAITHRPDATTQKSHLRVCVQFDIKRTVECSEMAGYCRNRYHILITDICCSRMLQSCHPLSPRTRRESCSVVINIAASYSREPGAGTGYRDRFSWFLPVLEGGGWWTEVSVRYFEVLTSKQIMVASVRILSNSTFTVIRPR